LKYQKEEAIKRESNNNDVINKSDAELLREKEIYRNLLSENSEMTKQYEDIVKAKERQAREIKELKEKELILEARIRSAHEDFLNRDISELKDLGRDQTLKRQEYLDSCRDVIRQLEDNITKVSNCGDLVEVQDTLTVFKRKVDELENDLKNKDSRIGENTSQNFNQRVDVDLNRKARSDFESENKDLSDVRANYDKLLLEHSRLKSENQTLDRQARDARADLQSVNERK